MRAILSIRGAVLAVAMLATSAAVLAAPALAQARSGAATVTAGLPGVALAEPVSAPATRVRITAPKINTSYTHTPPVNAGNDLPPGSGQVMTSTTIYYVFWLPAGQHFESDAAGDTNYENLLIRWAQDVGSTSYHNLVTQYSGTNGTITNSVTYGGSTTDTTAYPHAGTTGDPLGDGDIQAAVTRAYNNNPSWTEDVNHIVAVFTATGIHECMGGGSPCTFSSSGGFCAYHDHFNDGGSDAVYAFMAFDNFTHVAGKTCVAGETASDTDPNRGNYPNGD